MLEHELTGRSFRKSEHRRALMETISRSAGSIERKHMNISAVMAALGLPYIEGYKPYTHYQRALFEAVQIHLARRRDFYELLIGDAGVPQHGPIESIAGVSIAFDSAPPPREAPRQGLPEDLRRIVRRFEPPAERDARNRRLATAGESLVFELERHRLQATGRMDLSNRVRWVARDDGDGHGYDILSFHGIGDRADQERWLEVKTTNGPRTTPFFITRNELKVSRQRPDVFRIVRLYDFRRKIRGYRLSPPLEKHVWLSPTIYSASF